MKTTLTNFLRIFLLIFLIFFTGNAFSQTYKILFDNSKAQTAGNADWKVDDDEPYPSPANPSSESDWIGGISSWAYELWQTGNYEIVQLPQNSTITYGDTSNPLDLSNFDVFICVEPNIQFTDSEKTAIIDFVENGGGLFVVADHNGSDRNNDGIDSPRIWNDLFNNNSKGITNIFGVTFNLNSISGSYTDVRTNLSEPEDDALFNGSFGTVTGIAYHSGASMTVDTSANSNARAQIWTDSNHSDSDVVVATSRYGNGRIAFIGDSSPCDDGTGASGDTLYDGWNESGVTDREIFLNLTEWLASGSGNGTGITIGTPSTNPSQPQNGDDVVVSVDVSDSNGTIQSVVLMWKLFTSDTFNTVAMTNTSGDTYQGTIPAQSDTIVQYKIVATDNDGNTGSKGLFSYQVGYITICDLRNNANDSDGVNKYVGLNVKIQGIVTAPTLNCFGSSGKTEIYVQDSSGCGINVYNPNSDQPQVDLGDSVEVVGKVAQYKGKLEIDISSGSMTVLGTDTVPAPQVITCSQIGEDFEGKLVRINGVHVASGTIPAAGNSGSLTIEDSTGQATIYIDKDGDIDGMDTPSGDFDIVGIVSQYDSSSPYTSGYQLMPRFQSDFITSGSGGNTGKDLYFSEYIEGSSYNKALEIFNETGAAVDLSEYEIQLYTNGNTSASATITLSGTLNDGETFAICHTSADNALKNLCQMTSGSLNFNGDDAIVLVHNGNVVDSIGRVGEDPGSAWTGGGLSTLDMTLRRKPHVHQGDTTVDDAFDPSVEWEGYAKDTFDNIGQHTCLYTLHVEVTEGQGSTTPSGDNDYQYNSVVSVSATADNGYTFSGWTGFQTSNDNPISVTMNQDITLYAHFSASSGGSAERVYFSEYVEGSGNNKALEIYNETGSDIDLSEYTIEIYSNGATSVTHTVNLSGTLVDGDAFVIANPGASQTLLNLADTTDNGISYNGNDAIVLKHNGNVIDSIGQVGDDSYFGKDVTLRRKPHIHQGDTNPDDSFDRTVEWDVYAQDTFDDLGQHSCLYYLTTSVASGNGTVAPSGITEHQYKTSVSVTANPDNGYVFDHWEGDFNSTDNPFTFTIRNDTNIQAVFVQGSGGNQKDLYFSEYVEGSSNNKAVEIFNETGSNVDLSGYTIEIYNNNHTTPDHTINLSGTIADGDVYVIVYSGASQTLLNLADYTTNALSFNGNDAIVLKHNGNVIDAIGQVGNDSYYGKNKTLRRKPHIHQGDSNPNDAFDPSIEWNEYPQDTFDGLGSHECLYTLTTTVAGGGGSVNPSGANDYQYKTSVQITATPDNGYVFIGWSGDITSSDNPLTLTMDNDYTISATFSALGANGKDLYFSEYVEGSHSNKAVEIFNETGSNIDLSNYTIEIYNNGHSSPDHTIALSGTLNDGDTYVIVFNQADASLQNLADLVTAELSFNGDDAIVLKDNGVIIDCIGQIGVDPGAAWMGGGLSTKDMTLRRKPHIHQGDANASDAFDPSVEWDGYPQDTFDGLGSHECLYTLTVNVIAGNGSTNPSGANDYQYNTQVQITATPDTNSVFLGWSGDIVSTDNPITVTLNRDYTLNASFGELGANGKNLYFSEYLEGSGNNKAIEIYNETGLPIDLSTYTVEIYNNGHSSPDHTIALSGTLNDGDVFVIVFNQADASLQNLADLVTSQLSFNGNDAVVLKNLGVVIDCIGQVGVNPGSSGWTGNGISTKNMDLRRKPTIHNGDSNPDDAFDPSVEWDGYDLDDFSDIGNHQAMYSLTVNIGSGQGIVNPSGTNLYPYGSQVQITATPATGYIFDGWIGDIVSNLTSITVLMITDISITANFTPVFHTITATAGANGSILPSGTVQVLEGTDAVFTFIPDEGYKVDKVIVDGNEVEASNFYVFHNVMSDHTISVTFEEAIPPVIDDFSLNSIAGNAPFTFTATVNAHDPDGGSIVRYVWDITGARNYHLITSSNTLAHTLIKPGNYAISVTVVDDEGEIAVSENIEMTVSKSVPIVVPLPSSSLFKMHKEDAVVSSTIVNVFNENVALDIETLDENGQTVETFNETIPPYGTYTISSSMFSKAYTSIKVSADKYVVVFSEVDGDNYHTASYLNTNYFNRLYVPHIAEEIDTWETFAYVSNPSRLGIVCNVAGESVELNEEPSIVVNLESLLPSEPQVKSSWAEIKAFSDNPFTETNTLTGFEMFVKNNEDGAAVEINTRPSNVLYIPHIPEETDQFWTGLTLVNTESEEASITFTFYSADGTITGFKYLSLDAYSKFKVLLNDMLPDSDEASCWATITSSKALTGMELFGNYNGGICGYSLISTPQASGVIPGIKGGNYWNGIGIVNPSLEDTIVYLYLYDKNGHVKASNTVEVKALNRFKATVEQIFENATFEDGDTIRFASPVPVLIIKVSGDRDGKLLDALSATR